MKRRPKKDFGLVSAVTFSLLVHAALFAGFTFLDFFRTVQTRQAPVYYVDVVNLPVAHPRAGSPSGRASAPASPVSEPRKEEPRSPVEAPRKVPAPTSSGKKAETPAETEKDFRERISHLEKRVGERHAENAIERLRKKVAEGSGEAGMPGGTGTEAGSDYGSYIQSRLRDAFKKTITPSSRNPVVVVRLTIDGTGRLAGYRIERSSGDKAFENSVVRAMYLAEENFPPPPGKKSFQQGFIFKPEGVGKK